MALRAAVELAPAGMTIETFDIAPIEPYNEDVKQKGFPPPVQELRDKIRAADALLIVTPEYNYSIPGVLKNAIDWASRPPDQPFQDKPIAIMGASPGRLGSARAQYHLRQCFVFLNALILNTPEVMIANAAEDVRRPGPARPIRRPARSSASSCRRWPTGPGAWPGPDHRRRGAMPWPRPLPPARCC